MAGVFGSRRAASCAVLAVGLAMVGCGDDDDANDHDHDHDHEMDGGHDSGTHDSGTHDSGTHDSGDGSSTVSIDFEARVGSEPFDCGEMYALGTAGTLAMPLDFKLYVHDVALLTADGEQAVSLTPDGAFQSDEVVLLDFEDDSGSCSNGTAERNTRIRGTVPAGDYTGVRFTIGVPESRNHGNQATAESPLNLEGMFWSWTTGYKFLRIDVAPMHAIDDDAGAMDEDDAGVSPHGTGFLVHLGSTMCSGDPAAGVAVTCARDNRPHVRLPSFDPSTQKIVLDLAALFASSSLMHDQGGAPGCMSGGTDPECGPLFEQLGVSLSTGESTGNPAFLRVAEKQ